MTSIDDRVERLEGLAEGQAAINNLMPTLLERQQTLLERLDASLEMHNGRLDELQRMTTATQRLWVRLARHHGWLEDEDLFAA